ATKISASETTATGSPCTSRPRSRGFSGRYAERGASSSASSRSPDGSNSLIEQCGSLFKVEEFEPVRAVVLHHNVDTNEGARLRYAKAGDNSLRVLRRAQR